MRPKGNKNQERKSRKEVINEVAVKGVIGKAGLIWTFVILNSLVFGILGRLIR